MYGSTMVDLSKKFSIKLPSAKHFEYPKNSSNHSSDSEDNLDENLHWEEEVTRALKFRYRFHRGYHNGYHEKSLRHIFSKHSLPVAQGPAVPPLDCAQWPAQGKTVQEIFLMRTEFSHCVTQNCYEWVPLKTGFSAWTDSCDATLANDDMS